MTLMSDVHEIIVLLKKAESTIRDPIDYGSPVTLHGALILVKEIDRLRELVKAKDEALQRITKVSQFDHPTSQIIGSEEYEGAWLDCLDIAEEALKLK